MTEIYKIPQGKMIISYSDKNISIGLLELNANELLPKHNRLVKEELTQIYGSSIIEIFDEDNSSQKIILKAGDNLEIQEGKFHIHSNNSEDVSITLWKFEGDIANIIEDIRKGSETIVKDK
ncbi:MAG: hypothetical protein PHS27_01910 [Candidatus Pacebacteria bacterium]|nr:hypothetical protein [Candidatus Paceibacterota bacterium]